MVDKLESPTPLSLLQSQITSSDEQLSVIEKLLRALNVFFSKDDLDQKTFIEEINAIGMVEIETTNEFLSKYLGNDEKNQPYIDRIAQKVVDRRRVNNKSIDGRGVSAMINFVDAFNTNKQEVKITESMADRIRRLSGSP